ncbi:Uncharacterised protein [Paenibacillus thiaminolyticus]|nr:Uncharacterised protein [Paenibacillus thiaminolyticus]
MRDGLELAGAEVVREVFLFDDIFEIIDVADRNRHFIGDEPADKFELICQQRSLLAH